MKPIRAPLGSTMTTGERLRAALHGKPVDHVAFCPNLAYVWETTIPADIRAQGQPAFYDAIGCDHLHRFAPVMVRRIVPGLEDRRTETADGYMVEHITPVGTISRRYAHSAAGGTDFLVGHPLKTMADWKIQLWIEENASYELIPDAFAEHHQQTGGRGLDLCMLIAGRCKSAFQTLVEDLVGTEELTFAMNDDRDTVLTVWRAMVANNLRCVELSAQSEGEYFITWEDSSTQNYSPNWYEKYIASEISQWCAILAKAGKFYIQHACGHVRDIIHHMPANGVLAVESVSPRPTGNVTIAEVRAKTGAQFGIIGGLEPTELLGRDLASLDGYIRATIEEARGGPFILANSDSCPPGVTVEKFALAAQIARASSWA